MSLDNRLATFARQRDIWMSIGILEHMVTRLNLNSASHVTEELIQEWAGKEPLLDFLHRISLTIAKEFHLNSIPYDVADRLMNELVPTFWALDKGPTSPFWDVYLAFDAGEFHHRSDQTDNPIEDYTRPMVREILGRQHL